MKKVLECYNLTKEIDNKIIVKNITFDIKEGEILGFVGPNGAGKTTIIKMILGLYSITRGCVFINNYSIEENYREAIGEVGAIIESPDMYMYLTGYENLKIIANIYNLKDEDIKGVIKLVKLENSINNKVNTYSLGMRQRLGIAQALLHNPKLLILDEPTNGLDPRGIKELRELLKDLAINKHKAILISSHILNELDTICNKVCIINNGYLVYKSEISKDYIPSYRFKVDDTKLISKINIEANIIDNNIFEIKLNSNLIPDLIRKIINKNIKIYEVKEEKESLENIYFKNSGENSD